MPRRKKAFSRAVASVIESLETRCLLTTITGGGVDPITSEPIVNTFFYKDASDNIGIIAIGGNTTAEAIFGRVSAQSNNLILGDIPSPFLEDGDGSDLFHVYVSESDENSFISVYSPDDSGNQFAGNAGDLRVFTTGGLATVSTAGGTGRLRLGAVTKDVNPDSDIDDLRPIISRSINGAFGVRPDLGNRLTAGLQVADGLDFGRFYFSGTVFGQVIVPGSMESFYAGNLLTGDARGVFIGDNDQNRQPNFIIGGNLHSLHVGGTIGSVNEDGDDSPTYLSGFEMRVGGILGQVQARNSIFGGVNVIHGKAKSVLGSTVAEVEGIGGGIPEAGTLGIGQLSGSPLVTNDTFATAQYLPSFPGKKGRSVVNVTGQLAAGGTIEDFTDYYGLPLLAGQSLTVQLAPTVASTLSLIHVGIIDPDGRLIATDYANIDRDGFPNAPVRITADRPGTYRIVVATTGDGDFNGDAGEFPAQDVGLQAYQLVISGGGDFTLGGIVAGQTIHDIQVPGNFGFFVQNGDFGAVESGANIYSLTDQSINVRKGSFRSMESAAIGEPVNFNNPSPTLAVNRGHVGLIRSTTGNLSFNTAGIVLPIGGDYQVVDAAATLQTQMLTNRAIGVVRAGDMSTLTPNIFTVNADELNDDGIIDLIDVTGDFGTLATGGPQITTGPGGDVRYIHVGGTVFRDRFFGGNAPEETDYGPGNTVRLNDDSGALIEIEPFPVTANPLFLPGGTNAALIGPSIVVTAYGIRGSGGVAIINLLTDGSIRIGGGGGGGSQSHVQIGRVETTGAGNALVPGTTAGTLVFTNPTAGTSAVTLDVIMDGSAKVDVFEIVGTNLTGIQNKTVGEIVNIDMQGGSLGTLTGTTLGFAESSTGAAVNQIRTISNVFPFNEQHNGILASNILNVQSSAGVGNLSLTGSLDTLRANSGKKNSVDGFEGINGPIVATGSINTINIGEGILPSGSGNLARSGIFAGGAIGTITNQGVNSDIRGDIVSNTSILKIELVDGAIIGNKILAVTDFADSRRFVVGVTLAGVSGTITNPTFEINEIILGGVGGIIGSDIQATDIGSIVVRRGFGIFNSFIGDGSAGVISSIVAEGYGIRGVEFDGGSLLNNISASAKPKNVSVLEYTSSVRQSEQFAIDPFFDQAPNTETDLHEALGTSAAQPQIKRVTDTGVIADSIGRGNRNLGKVFASQIRNSTFNFANQIGTIQTRGVIEGLSLTSGRLKDFYAGGSASNLIFNISGVIEKARVNGDINAASTIRALGSNARIISLIVDGTLNGDVSSANKFDLLAIGKDLGAPSLIKAKVLTTQQIKGSIFGTISIG